MPCGHHFGHHYGYTPSRGYPCPYCGYYHAPSYGPGWQPGWTGHGFGYGPPTGWAPPGPPTWALPGYGPAAAPPMSDEDIRRAVDHYLRTDPRISPEARIELEVSNGAVTLTGSVPDKWAKQAVNEIIFAIPGVVDVENRLQVARRASKG